jgi:hypothetical protein
LFLAGKFGMAIKLAERFYHPQNPRAILLKLNVIQKYISRRLYEDAELLGLDLVENSKALFGEKDKFTLECQLYHSVAMSKLGCFNAAEELLSSLVMYYDQLYKETDIKMFSVRQDGQRTCFT